MQPFEMSIEAVEGFGKRQGFHLGTNERLARQIIEERYAARVAAGMLTITIGLMQGQRLIDTYYGGGKWASDQD